MRNAARVLIAIVALLSGMSPVASEQPVDGLSIELIDKRIASLRESGAGEDDQVLQAYTQAKTLLDRAASFKGDEANYVAALTSAPEQQADIQRRIDKLGSTYDPIPEIADFTAQEVTTRLALARAEQNELTARINSLDGRLSGRETTATEARSRLRDIDERAKELTVIAPIVNAADAPSLAQAVSWHDAAESLTLNAERRAKEAQLASQPVRYGAMAAERAELAMKLERLANLIKALNQRSLSTVQPVMDISELGIPATDPAYTVATTLIDLDATLREQQIALNKRLIETRRQNSENVRVQGILEDRYATARRIADFAGEGDTQGQVLLTYWEEFSNLVLKPPTGLSREASRTVISRIKHEETLSRLVNATGFIKQLVVEAGIDPGSIPPATQPALLDLTRSYRARLRSVIADESDYIDTLSGLQSSHSALTGKVSEYRTYLEGRILWISNYAPLWKVDFSSIGQSMSASRDYVGANIKTLKVNPGPTLIMALLAALVLLRYRPRLIAMQNDLAGNILRPRDDSIRFTLLALWTAALRAAPLPIILFGLAKSLDATASPASGYIVQLLGSLALLLFLMNLTRIVFEPSGIGRVHFNWREVTADRVHVQLTFATRWWIPITAVAAVATRLAPVTGDEVAARGLILVSLGILIYRLVKHEIPEIRLTGKAWFTEPLNRLRLLLTLALVILAVQTVYGQVFTVNVVAQCLMETVWTGVVLLLIHALLLRWLRVAQRHLRLNELLARRARLATSENSPNVEEEEPDLGDISLETRQLVTASTVVAAIAALLYAWSPLLPAFDAFSRVLLWTSTSVVDGETVTNRITLATLVSVTVLAGLTLFTARKLPAVIEVILRSRTQVSPGARYTISTLLNYVVIGAGVIAALSALGLQWGQLQWLVAALGVGIGFGLQEIVANFISGLIILFERPIRVGDIVTIGEKDGTVTKIRIRATTIRDWDGKELIVPNKEFVTGRLLNWTLSDANTRVTVKVGIAYGSDVAKALEILRDVAVNHPKTVREPAPLIVFENFGDNALELSSRSFIDTLEGRLKVMTEIRQEINRRFAEAGIVIAFPQRDVHLDTQGPIRIALDQPHGG